eukprot:12785882-Ditylum_brightwellii.AAC.1
MSSPQCEESYNFGSGLSSSSCPSLLDYDWDSDEDKKKKIHALPMVLMKMKTKKIHALLTVFVLRVKATLHQ